MKYKAVIWDFDGVWSKDRFYKSLEVGYPKVWNYIHFNIWGENDRDLVDKWMRAELNMNDINKIISKDTGINYDLLTKTFLDDVKTMKIENRHRAIAESLKNKGVKIGLVTNNMEVFSTITEPRLGFKELFNNNVFNSFDYKMLKAEGLFDVALKKMGSDYQETLLIDDSARARTAFETKGGNTYSYTNFDDFNSWVNKNLLF